MGLLSFFQVTVILRPNTSGKRGAHSKMTKIPNKSQFRKKIQTFNECSILVLIIEIYYLNIICYLDFDYCDFEYKMQSS